MKNPRKQRGVALITALVIVALAVTVTAFLSFDQQVDIRRSANLFYTDQAYQYALLAEEAAMEVLIQDANESKVDSLDEAWALTWPPLSTEDGAVSGEIIDLQGRININNLVSGEDKVDPIANERIERLLNHLKLEAVARSALIDWIDKNINPLDAYGAEDDYYLGLDAPYRCPNAPMVSISELRLVRGFNELDKNTFRVIADAMTALPVKTPVNVNTAPYDVLIALGLNEAAAAAVRVRLTEDERPYKSVQEFLQDPALQGQTLKTKDLAVTSQYFLLHAVAQAVDGKYELHSLLFREKGKIRVLMRSQTPL